MKPKNVDAILVQDMQEKMTNSPPQPITPPVEPTLEADTPITHPEPQVDAQPIEIKDEIKEESPVIDESKENDSSIDEYGNPVEKPRTYTEDEVNSLIRERLARNKQPENFKPVVEKTSSPEESQDWEKELENFIDKTIQKRDEKSARDKWEQQESIKQADFEARFTTGMKKYSDFHQIVAKQPITDSMMVATRGLENPAAFLYGAAKLHPEELQRISSIPDDATQAMEIGRLHEKMIKNSRLTSAASKPIAPIKGDMPTKRNNQASIEQRINDYAKQKQRR